jgi:hypothetical protein
MIRCEFYKEGQCLESENKRFLKTSGCYGCNSGKDYQGKRLKHPICVLTCGNCEEETCNIGEVVNENNIG